MALGLILSREFENDIKKVKDRSLQNRIKKMVQKIVDMPESGKPLRYELAGFRSIRMSPFRIIYEVRKGSIIIHKFDHRKRVY